MSPSRRLKFIGRSRTIRFASTAAIILTMAAAIATQAQDTADSVQSAPTDSQIEETGSPVDLEALNQRLLVLERLREVDKEEAEQAVKKVSKVSAGEKDFKLESPDGAYSLRVGAFFQALGLYFPVDDDEKLVNDLLIRRTRLDFRASLGPHFDFRFQPAIDLSTLTILEAHADLKWVPEFGLRVGKFKGPVGLERLQSVSRLVFPEFSIPTSLVPNRDVGIQVQGVFNGGVLEYQAGVFQGTTDGGSSDADNSDDKDFAGRIFTHPFLKTNVYVLHGLGLGIAGTWGERSNTPAGFRTQARTRYFTFKTTDTLDGVHLRVSPQAYFYTGPISLLGEYVFSRQAIRLELGEPEDIDAIAWQVQAGWLLTGEEASWKGVKPAKPLDLKEGGLGALRLTARIHSLEVDDAAFPTYANPATASKKILAYTGGLNWYPNSNVTVFLNYELSTLEGGAAGGEDRDDEHAVITSLNVAF